ncbi:MAG: 4Fe-4S dicluster domain-containing protein [Gemmatimonadales bacterium]
MMIPIAVAVGAILFLMLALTGAASLLEREPRAAGRALLLAVLAPLPYAIAALLPQPYGQSVAAALLLLTAVVLLALVIPTPNPAVGDDTPRTRIDERDIMFSRRLLEPGTDRFEQYYGARPTKRELDDRFRVLPGLLSKGASAYSPYTFSAADASFWTIERLRPFVDAEPAAEQVESDAREITEFIEQWALELGAASVGVTELRDYHLYTTVGRGPQWGEPVRREHDFAIALTVEMDKEMIACAPQGPTVMESAQQYVAAGVIAVQIADFIRRLGYAARAHIDGNYRVVCPLVARDAGLGEIGRMGLLMTPELGPRVRIGVVTTTLPLVPDVRRRDPTTIDFCTHCRKCADVCPSNAISHDGQAEIDGVRRWQIDQEACFTYWCSVGTDCARCVAVCPYSHPDTLLHNIVRRGVRHSSVFRRAAIWGDDLLYGKRPPPAKVPDWMALEPKPETPPGA